MHIEKTIDLSAIKCDNKAQSKCLKKAMKKTENILILFVKPNTKAHKNGKHDFVEALMSHLPSRVNVDFTFYDNLCYTIVKGKAKIYDTKNSKDLKEYDLVNFRFWHGAGEQAAACAEYLKKSRVAFYDREVGEYRSKSKLSEYFRLWAKGLPVPDTLFCRQPVLEMALGSNPAFKLPLVVKDIDTSKGKNNFLVKSTAEISDILKANPENSFVVQNFIPNDGDYRVLVFGRSISGVIHRQRTSDKTHLNNTSQDATATLVDSADFNDDFKKLAIKAAAVMKRQVAGVDLVVDSQTSKISVLEVNNTPQIDTGTFADNKVLALAEYFSKGQSIKTKRHIRTFASIDIPELGIFGLKSKIDTGASLSAIHATNFIIDAKTKKLSFTLLDDEHPQYNNKVFSTKHYSLDEIRSSNGQSEKRYTVELPIVYNRVKYKVMFSLSNRKSMRNPVLLGRRFLRDGNFVVRVK